MRSLQEATEHVLWEESCVHSGHLWSVTCSQSAHHKWYRVEPQCLSHTSYLARAIDFNASHLNCLVLLSQSSKILTILTPCLKYVIVHLDMKTKIIKLSRGAFISYNSWHSRFIHLPSFTWNNKSRGFCCPKFLETAHLHSPWPPIVRTSMLFLL